MSPCLPAVYIFVLRCLYPGTDKHNLIGYPQALLLEEIAAMRQWGGGATSIKHVRAAVEAHPLFTHHLLHYICSLYGGNSGRGLCINGYSSSLKAITQKAFPNIPPEWACRAHFGRLFLKNPVLLLPTPWVFCFPSGLSAAQSLVVVFCSENFNGEAVLGSFYHPQMVPPSAVWAAEECDAYNGQQWRAVLCCKKLLRRQKPSWRRTRLP